MATWPLSKIQEKIREFTGRYGSSELSNSEIKERVNDYYQLIMPAELKIEKNKVYYRFLTSENQAYYDQPDELFTNFEPPAMVNNIEIDWFYNEDIFRKSTNFQYTFSMPWTGDGSTLTFTTNVVGFPISPGYMTVSDGLETFQDLNKNWTTEDVTVTGDKGGSLEINYSTGSISVTFNTAPLNGSIIHVNYVLFTPRRPQSILIFNSQFQLWPVPDEAYVVEMSSYQTLPALVKSTDTPLLNEWGPLIVYGTSRYIFSDNGEMAEGYSDATVLYNEQIDYALSRVEEDMLHQRAKPKF